MQAQSNNPTIMQRTVKVMIDEVGARPTCPLLQFDLWKRACFVGAIIIILTLFVINAITSLHCTQGLHSASACGMRKTFSFDAVFERLGGELPEERHGNNYSDRVRWSGDKPGQWEDKLQQARDKAELDHEQAAQEQTVVVTTVGSEMQGSRIRVVYRRSQFKALVLTFDAHHIFALNMIARYKTFWPEHPFVFLVPYNGQEAPVELFHEYLDQVQLVQTTNDTSISGTMLQLLEHCKSPQEMVYLVLDDKYPTVLNSGQIETAIDWMRPRLADLSFGGLHMGFMRNINSCTVDLQTQISFAKSDGMEHVNLVQCKGRCTSFWTHHFLRAWMLQDLYRYAATLTITHAKEYDTFIGNFTWKNSSFWTISGCGMEFGESTHAGKVTKNCYNDLKKSGLADLVLDTFMPPARVIRLKCPTAPCQKQVAMEALAREWDTQ